jgi:hypothetical protein
MVPDERILMAAVRSSEKSHDLLELGQIIAFQHNCVQAFGASKPCIAELGTDQESGTIKQDGQIEIVVTKGLVAVLTVEFKNGFCISFNAVIFHHQESCFVIDFSHFVCISKVNHFCLTKL